MSLTNLTYNEAGQGMPVVLIHGFCESKAIWKNFVTALQDNYRVIAIDLPGFGENPPLEHPVTIADLARSVLELLDSIQVDKCVMIGHSLGGYVSLAFGEKFPQRLSGLGLFHSTAHSDSQEKKQGRNKTIEFIQRHGVEEFVDEFVAPLFYDGRRKEMQEEINWMIDIGKQAPKSTVIETIKAMRDRKDRSKVLEKATYPVLFIAGRNDTALHLAPNVHQFWLPQNASVHILSETGHMGMLEREKETICMVRGFLETIELREQVNA